MVPLSFHDFFSGCATIAGALIGLLFVALSVTSEYLTGANARTDHQVRAGAAFSALVNTMVIALFALLPTTDLETVGIILAAVGLGTTVALVFALARENKKIGRSDLWMFLVLLVLYGLQLANAVELSQAKLHAFVGRGKTKPAVEPVRGLPGLVAGQLHDGAATPAGFVDRPGHHRLAEATAAIVLTDPDGLDLRPQGAAAGQARQERQLERGDDLRVHLRHHEQVGAVAVDGVKRLLISRQVLRRAHPVPGCAELVGGEQVHDRGQVPRYGPPHDGHRGAQVNPCQFRHAPSLPDGGRGPVAVAGAIAGWSWMRRR